MIIVPGFPIVRASNLVTEGYRLSSMCWPCGLSREACAEQARLYIHAKFTSKQQLFLNTK
jgi:hypothetical protein